MKKILIIILTIILGVNLVGCNLNFTEKNVNITSLNGLPAVTISKLNVEEVEILKGYKTNYKIENKVETLKEDSLKGDLHIALVPTDVAAQIYNENKDYQIAGTIGLGSYYLVTSDNNITGFDSTLSSKKVAMVKENSMTDSTTKSILVQNEVDVSSIDFQYYNTEPEIVTALASGQITTGIIPETSLTTLLYKHSGLKILSSTNEAYEKAFNINEGYPQFSVIVKEEFAKENPEYIKAFLKNLKESIDYINENPVQSGAYGEKLGVPVKPQVLSKAIKRCNLKFISIKDFKNNYEKYFSNLYNYDTETVGGTVPDDSIYYEE
ncbi:MAG: ABC transporter substrate-binding protein [Terrisporobacter sp.]|uniref:ABC transporter substrate-binding protein n=1 Tax=Terrisporobacter sp. TaxID=1965305 RepID=UPI002FC9CAC1